MLLLTGEGDLLIPSREEGPRLQKLLPRCQLKVCLAPDNCFGTRCRALAACPGVLCISITCSVPSTCSFRGDATAFSNPV